MRFAWRGVRTRKAHITNVEAPATTSAFALDEASTRVKLYWVATTNEAIEFLDRLAYSLVISDWRLPDGNGLLIADIAAELGAQTIVMSGYLFQMPADRVNHFPRAFLG